MRNIAELEPGYNSNGEAATRHARDNGEASNQAWLNLAGSFIVYFISFGFMNSFGFFQEYYSQEYLAEFSSSVIALVGTLQLGLMYITGPVVGALFDAYGPQVCLEIPIVDLRR